jgi:MATE family multidrug resistance protein
VLARALPQRRAGARGGARLTGSAQDGAALAPELARFARRPHHTIATLSFPVVVSLVAEPITGLVDTAFVARLGAAELAALGVGTALLSSALWVFNFLGIGTQTEVAQAVGTGDRVRSRELCGTAVVAAAGIGVALAALAAPALPWLVAAMGAQGPVADAARVYLGIRLLGAPPLLVTMVAMGALRGLHDMRTPLWIALGTNAANIALNSLLIFGAGPIPALGVAGAAWATTASQWIGGVWGLAIARRRIGRPDRVDLRDVRALFVVGRDLFVRTGLLVTFVLLGTRAATRIGTDAGAAHQAIRQIWLTTALLLDAYAAVAQTLVGTALGAGQLALARRAAGVAARWACASGAALAVAMLAGEAWVAAALVPETARGVFSGAWRVAALAQPINALSFATDGVHWGTRDYRYLRDAMLASTAVGAGALAFGEWTGTESLFSVWIATTAWISLRAIAGIGLVWPGWGRSPLRPQRSC